MPGVTLWIDQYQVARQPVTLSVIVTDSKYSLTPLWAFPSNGGPYFLRINYALPCDASVEVLTARASDARPRM